MKKVNRRTCFKKPIRLRYIFCIKNLAEKRWLYPKETYKGERAISTLLFKLDKWLLYEWLLIFRLYGVENHPDMHESCLKDRLHILKQIIVWETAYTSF